MDGPAPEDPSRPAIASPARRGAGARAAAQRRERVREPAERYPAAMPRGAARTLLLLFVLGLAARAGFGLAQGLGGPPLEDERGYVALARSLADGRGFELALPESLPPSPPRTSFRAPLVPLLMAPLAAAGAGVEGFRWAAILAGSLVAPIAWIGLRRTRLGDFAVCPAAVLALWPPAVHLSVRVLSEPFAAAFLLASLAVPPADGVAASALRRGALSGIFAGLAVLARPAALPAALLVACARGGRDPLRFAAAHVVALVLVVAPWVVRNAELHGRPLLTTNTGVTLLGGNCDASLAAGAPGKWAEPSVAWGVGESAPDLGIWGWSGLSEEASDRRFSGAAVAWVRDRPGAAAELAFWKVVRLLDPDPHSAKDDAPLKRVVGWVSAGPVLLLAAFGLRRALAKGSGFGPWGLLAAGTVVTAVVFYGDTRFRTPADPVLLGLAGLALLGGSAPTACANAGSAPPRAGSEGPGGGTGRT